MYEKMHWMVLVIPGCVSGSRFTDGFQGQVRILMALLTQLTLTLVTINYQSSV